MEPRLSMVAPRRTLCRNQARERIDKIINNGSKGPSESLQQPRLGRAGDIGIMDVLSGDAALVRDHVTTPERERQELRIIHLLTAPCARRNMSVRFCRAPGTFQTKSAEVSRAIRAPQSGADFQVSEWLTATWPTKRNQVVEDIVVDLVQNFVARGASESPQAPGLSPRWFPGQRWYAHRRARLPNTELRPRQQLLHLVADHAGAGGERALQASDARCGGAVAPAFLQFRAQSFAEALRAHGRPAAGTLTEAGLFL